MDWLDYGCVTHPPPPPVKLCVVVVQLSSNQQHNTDKSSKTKIEFGQNKFPTQTNFRPNFFYQKLFSKKKFRHKFYFDTKKNPTQKFLTQENLRQNLFWTKKFPTQICFGPKQITNPNLFWQKNFQPKKYFGQQKFQSTFFWVKQNFDPIFFLTKFDQNFVLSKKLLTKTLFCQKKFDQIFCCQKWRK